MNPALAPVRNETMPKSADSPGKFQPVTQSNNSRPWVRSRSSMTDIVKNARRVAKIPKPAIHADTRE